MKLQLHFCLLPILFHVCFCICCLVIPLACSFSFICKGLSTRRQWHLFVFPFQHTILLKYLSHYLASILLKYFSQWRCCYIFVRLTLKICPTFQSSRLCLLQCYSQEKNVDKSKNSWCAACLHDYTSSNDWFERWTIERASY